jgi:ADP-ribosyl-[dinitrogen reductase] hydrolase
MGMITEIDRDRARGALLGLACGDAVGTTVEFCSRDTFEPLTDMAGGGPFRLGAGQWTDDTSMALCLAESLVSCGRFDPRDQTERYVRWWREGHLSSTGTCFDIGNTTRSALSGFEHSGNPFSGPTDPNSAGNGSIMRMAPAVLYHAPHHEAAVHYAGESSRTTHGARAAIDACRLMADRLLAVLEGADKEEMLLRPFRTVTGPPLAPEIQAIADGAWKGKPRSAIRGTGYVVESLEAALWCFDRTDSYREAVLLAANLGDDADTTAAVCGQLAGAYHGASGIPADWLARLHMRERIEDVAEQLAVTWPLPYGRCYWVEPGRVLAGEYPGHWDAQKARARIRALMHLGVRTFVNLMEEDETNLAGEPFRPYAPDVREEAQRIGLGRVPACLRFPIRDLGVPSRGQLAEILQAIEDSLDREEPVYVHCWGGRGRTGMVVGSLLIRHGHATREDFVEKISLLRKHDLGGGRSPETEEQVSLVRGAAGYGR